MHFRKLPPCCALYLELSSWMCSVNHKKCAPFWARFGSTGPIFSTHHPTSHTTVYTMVSSFQETHDTFSIPRRNNLPDLLFLSTRKGLSHAVAILNTARADMQCSWNEDFPHYLHNSIQLTTNKSQKTGKHLTTTFFRPHRRAWSVVSIIISAQNKSRMNPATPRKLHRHHQSGCRASECLG